jgi:DNA repair protein NreA
MPIQLFDTELCARCRGRGFCKKPCRIYSKIKDFTPKTRTHFSGSSPPEIFVGRFDYPNISAGILAPDNSEYNSERNMESSTKESAELAYPEIWHEKKYSINTILTNRSKLIYGKFKTQIKKARTNDKFTGLMQEISMAYKSVSTEFFLRKAPQMRLEINKHLPLIGNPAPLQYARLQENPKVKPKVDYLVSDTDSKAVTAIKELYKADIQITNINKILSAGLLGKKTQRRLVPTRWSITAVDDTLSKSLLAKIRYYPEISEIMLFNSEYNGNHYEILLLPDKFSFEVLEAEISGSLWNQTGHVSVMKDYELFSPRKYYASSVTGAYYANRLGLAEYLEKIKRQATAIFIREVGPEYYAPLGVGILREITRQAFKSSPEKFSIIEEALTQAQTRLRIPITNWTNESALLKEFGRQKRLSQWF